MTVAVQSPPMVNIERVATLTDAVINASKAISSRPAVPALHGLRLESLDNGMIQVSGFDYETAVSVRINNVGEPLPHPVLVPAAMFRTVLKNLDQREGVGLSVWDDHLHLYQVVDRHPHRAKLALMKLGDFPSLPKVPRGRHFTISGRGLEFIATKVTPFRSRDSVLPVLNATRLELSDDGRLSAMATDRYRAAFGDVKVRLARTKDPVSALVPHMELVGALFKGVRTVAVTFGPNKADHNNPFVHFHSDNITVSLYLLVEGDYPRLRGLFAHEYEVRATVEPKAFLKTLKFASSLLGRHEPVELDMGDGKVRVTGITGDGNDVSHGVDAETVGDLKVRYNPDYLRDAVRAFGGPVTIEANDARRPAQFTSPGTPGLRVLLMPVRTRG